MMATSFLEILVLLLGGANVNHLLDLVSSEVYWKQKGVVVSVESMQEQLRITPAADISKLIAELSSPNPQARAQAARTITLMGETVIPQLEKATKSDDPETSDAAKKIIHDIRTASKAAQVRRLMAIRTLGELGKAEGVPTLAPLAQSKEPFVAEYAGRALAQLNKQPFERPSASPEDRKSDVMCLPAGARVVVSVALVKGPGRTIDEVLADMQLPDQPMFPNGPLPPNKAQIKAKITEEVLKIVEETGDIRLDSLAVGVSGEVGDKAGYVGIIARGEYDAGALAAFLRKMKAKSEAVQGVEVFAPDNEVAFFTTQSGRFVFTAGASREQLPLKELIDAIANGKSGLGDEKEMAPLLKDLDMSAMLTGVVKMTPAFKQAPILNVFDLIRLSGKAVDKSIELSVTGEGSDAEQVKQAVTQINDGVQQGIAQMKEVEKTMPAMKPMRQVMETIKCAADGKKAGLTAQLPRDMGMIGPMLMWAMPMHAAPMPPAEVVPQPPPPPPPVVEPVQPK